MWRRTVNVMRDRQCEPQNSSSTRLQVKSIFFFLCFPHNNNEDMSFRLAYTYRDYFMLMMIAVISVAFSIFLGRQAFNVTFFIQRTNDFVSVN